MARRCAWFTGLISPLLLMAPKGAVCQIVGGAISPLLLNIALHGMEAALGVKHDSQGTSIGKRAVVRYADDFVVFCESQEDALVVTDRILPDWLAQRGLSLSAEKTR